MNILIQEMEIIDRQLNERTRSVARFTALVGPIQVSGCEILEGDNGLVPHLPQGRTGNRVMRFRNAEDFGAFRRSAVAEYRRLMGQ